MKETFMLKTFIFYRQFTVLLAMYFKTFLQRGILKANRNSVTGNYFSEQH